MARRSIRRKRVAVAESEPAGDVAEPEAAEDVAEPEAAPEPSAPNDEEIAVPNVFAGRRCPKTEGAKGWLVWQHIVKSFAQLIDPNLPERSRTKHEYDYWKMAKKAFDEDDSVVSEGDFKTFFLVQAEVYVQEKVVLPIQVFLEWRDGIQTKARIYPAGLGARLLEIFKFLKTTMAPCTIRGEGDALEMFRSATYEDECSDGELQEVPGAMDPVTVRLAKVLLSKAWSGQQKPEEPVEQDEREKLLELLQSQAKLIEQLRGGASAPNLCQTPDAKRSNRTPRRRLTTKTPSPNAKNKTPSPSKKNPSPSKKDPSPSKKDPSPSKKDPSPVKKDQPGSIQALPPQDIPDEDDAKYWNKMRSKVNRFCGPTASGKLRVSDDIHAMWKKAGTSRDVLVSLMAEAHSYLVAAKGDFIRKVEVYKETQKFRKQMTDGGIIEMAEANPALKRINKYDGEPEYWVDIRTHGTRGLHEIEGVRDSTSAKGKVDSLADSSKPEDLDKSWNHDPEPTGVEEGKDRVKDSLQRHMNEAVTSRDKLSKFMERLDEDDASVATEMPKMLAVIKALGNHYDELAKLQADAKVQELTGLQQDEFSKVCEAVKRQMIMATSLEIKNKKLKKKPGKPAGKRDLDEPVHEANPKKKPKKTKGKDCVEKLRRETGGESLAIFKIGITHDCTPRFQLYESNGYTKMLVMHTSNELATIEMLESALIAIYGRKVQCRNVQLGGEGMRNRYFEAKFASAKHVATIAKAFATEANPALADMAKAPLNDAEKSLQAMLRKWDLTLNVPWTYTDLGDTCSVPMLRPTDYVATLFEKGYLHKLLGGSVASSAVLDVMGSLLNNLSPSRLRDFWSKYKQEEPNHDLWLHDFLEFDNLVPLYIHGDGGRTYCRDELMVVAFQPILGLGSRKSNPLMLRTGKPGVNLQGHSFTTRFLIGVLYKGIYKEHPSRFDNFMTEAFRDLEQLFYHGYNIGDRVLRFVVLGTKGDLPFLARAGHLNRSFLNIRKGPEGPKSRPLTGCCWLCHAGTPGYNFEDLGLEPKWLETCGPNNPPPWEALAPFFDHLPYIVQDKASFFTLDLLHIYFLGIGRDYGASALVMALGIYNAASVPEALDALNVDFRSFLKSTHKQVHFKKLTRDLLGYPADTAFPCGHWSKATDTPVLVEFASWVLQKNKDLYDRTKIYQVVVSGCTAMGHFMKTLLEASLWMSKTEAVAAGNAGLHFLRCYQKAADLSFQARALRFNLVPKLHCYHHVCLELLFKARRCDNILNPLSRATFQDEDYIGRVSRLSRRVSPKLLCLRTIQRYLVATRVELDKDRR
ncbi:unnamed protein product [Symbiodinium sp. CCMP2456]|nr:unnamed protein product [Symbiodinium sp. CCMP2456]